ncbi:MAG: DMT family transporter, partial [Rhodobacteraceae bacterium]|nr:DMT family transporter [Paracoccaceae bacterium]
MQRPTPVNWISIGVLGLIWGATFMVVALALDGYGPLTVAAARTTLGALTLGAATLALGRRTRIRAAHLPFLLGVGLCSTALPFFLLSWGQQQVASAFAGLSMAAVPLFVLPLAHLFVPGERMSLPRVAGFCLGFAGVLVLIGPDALSGQGAALPRLACFGAALSYACSAILTRRCPPIDPVVLAALSLVVGSLVLVPVTLAHDGWPHLAAPQAVTAILFLGLVPTALAALLRVTIIRSAGPAFMTLTNYQVPLWSALFGALVLGES